MAKPVLFSKIIEIFRVYIFRVVNDPIQISVCAKTLLYIKNTFTVFNLVIIASRYMDTVN